VNPSLGHKECQFEFWCRRYAQSDTSGGLVGARKKLMCQLRLIYTNLQSPRTNQAAHIVYCQCLGYVNKC